MRIEKRRLLSWLLTLCMVAGIMPVVSITAFATSANNAMLLGTSVLQADVNTATAQYLYYGASENTPYEWRVIGYGDEGVAAGAGKLTLLAAQSYGLYPFSSAETPTNEYANSTLETAVNNIADAFSNVEQGAISTRTLLSGSYNGVETDCIAGNQVENARLWPLSTKEATATDESLRALEQGEITNATLWSLRSPSLPYFGASTACVMYDGYINYDFGFPVTTSFGVRPAFNLNLESVLFTSAATNGKKSGSLGANALQPVLDTSTSDWKLTLLDPARTFNAKTTAMNITSNTLTVSYTGASTGTNEYISVIVLDSNENIIYYGNIAHPDAENGTADVTLPEDFDSTNDKMYVFSEQCNSDKRTDYASNYVEIQTISAVNVSGVTVDSKNYDRSPVEPDVTDLTVWDDKNIDITGYTGPTFKYSGIGNTVYEASTAPTGAGTYELEVSVTVGDFTGKMSVPFTIYPLSVRITGLEAESKTYDGNTDVTISGEATVAGVLENDVVNVSAGTATFSNKNVGKGKTIVFSGYSLAGSNAGNYTLSQQPVATANIDPAPITVSGITAEDKDYDENTVATLKYDTVVFDGKIGTDTLSVTATGTFVDANAGEGKTVNLSALTLGGTDVNNYQLKNNGQQSSTTATIRTIDWTGAKTADVSVANEGQTGVSVNLPKIPDGSILGTPETTASSFITNAGSIADGKLTFDVARSVKGTKGDITILASGGNYNNFTITIHVTSAESPVTISGVTVPSKTYDSNAVQPDISKITVSKNNGGAAVTGYGALTYSYTSTDDARYNSATAPKDAGAYQLVVSLNDGTYTGSSAAIPFTIKKAPVTVKTDNKAMTKDDTLPGFTVSYTGFVGLENAGNAALKTLAVAACEADGKTVGAYPITIDTNAELNGTVGKNYEIKEQKPGVLTVSEPAFQPDTIVSASAQVQKSDGTAVTAEEVSVAVNPANLAPFGKISADNKVVITYTTQKGETGTIVVTYDSVNKVFVSDPTSVKLDGGTGKTYSVDTSGLSIIPANVEITESKGEVSKPADAELASKPEEAKAVINSAAEVLKTDTGVKSEGLAAAASDKIDSATAAVESKDGEKVTAEEGKTQLNQAGVTTDGAPVTLVVQPYLNIAVKDASVDTNTGAQNLTYNIEPFYNVLATTATDKDYNTTGQGGTQNAVVIESAIPMIVTTPVTITVALPNGFPVADLFVAHEKNGTTYYYAATITNVDGVNYATFVNPHGFSDFTFKADGRTGTINYVDWGSETYDLSNLGDTLPTPKTTPSGQRFTDWTIEIGGQTFHSTTLTDEILTAINGKIATATANFERIPSGGSGGGTTSYTITASAEDGGSISPNGKVSVTRNASKTFTITPASGYRVSDVLVDGKSVGAVTTYTFEKITANHTISAEFAQRETVADPTVTGVADWLVTDDHIVYLHGYSNGNFGPNDNMTRAQAAQMFYNLLRDKNVATTANYSDIPDGAWYETAANTLSALGVMTGIGDNKFDPDRSITRAEFTVVAMRFAKLDTSGENYFTDVSESNWFYAQVKGAIKYGWIGGYSDNTFRPYATITRAEVTTIVNRMLGRSADETYVDAHTDSLKLFPDVSKSYWAYYNICEATNAHDYTKTDSIESWSVMK